MAYPGTMNDVQKASHQAWMRDMIRPVAGEAARFFNHIEAALTEYHGAQNNTDGNMSRLESGDMIPVTGSRAGAEEIDKDDVLTFLTNLINLESTYNTAALRSLYAELAGETELIG